MYKLESGKFIPVVLWDQRDIKMVTAVFWKLTKCILLSPSLFYFKELSPKYSNPAWISHSAPPVILTLGTAVLWKSAPFPLPGSSGKKLSWSYQECASPLPCGCVAFRETGVTKCCRGTGHSIPLEKLGKGGGQVGQAVLFLCFWEAGGKLETRALFFPASWGVLERWKV